MKLQTFMLVCVFMHCMETVKKIPRLTILSTRPWATDGNYPTFKAKAQEVRAKKKDADEVYSNDKDLLPCAFYLTIVYPNGDSVEISMVKVGRRVFATLKACIKLTEEGDLEGFHPSWLPEGEDIWEEVQGQGIQLEKIYEDASFVFYKAQAKEKGKITLQELQANYTAPILKDKVYTEGFFWEHGLYGVGSVRGLIFLVNLDGPKGVTRGGHVLKWSCGAGLYSINTLGFTELIGLVVPNAHQPLAHGDETVMGSEEINFVPIGSHIARFDDNLRKKLGIKRIY